MLNQIVLVGRLVKNPVLKETEQGKKHSFVTLAIPRSFKNADGSYDTDFIDCVLWDGIAKNTVEYCKKGDIIGVKGRLQSRKYETNNTAKYVVEVVAEKVTFLTSRKEADE